LILVDTNVWSELTKPRGDPAVLAWLEANDDDLALSVMVIAEIQYGIALPGAARKRPFLENWLEGLRGRYFHHTLPFGDGDADHFGRIAAHPEAKAREPQVFDMLIAAQAQHRSIPVATRNCKDFEWIGVELINPWEG
jgi:toxin FitB